MKITIDPSRRTKALGDLFGIFFEDLNHSADGGLYGELVRNRDFEFEPVDNAAYTPFTAWHTVGGARYAIETENPPFPENPHYVRVMAGPGEGLANEGYDGIYARAGVSYRLRMWLRGDSGACVTARLGSMSATVALTDSWACHEASFAADETRSYKALSLTADVKCTFDVAYVSLFPNDCIGVMRRDLAEALRDMRPRFLRFPGGCLTHDGQLDRFARDGIYNWKNTLGPVENRPGKRNSWGYHQTLGLGFYEYFLFCEQIGAQPIPVVCGGCDPHHRRFASGDILERYIHDAVDLIDFAKGGVDTEWGGIRAKMGHPEPFELRYIAIGNEEVHQEFFDRLPRFVKAIRERDPSIRIIGTAGPHPAGREFEREWQSARECGVDFVDEHYYQAPEWYLANMDRYDGLTERDPKVFLGEFASWGNTLENALAEAAYMTAMQNAPAVGLCCYAPLLCHAKYVNWQPDMIWFDGGRVCRTVNYYVQKLFMTHQGDTSLACDAELGAALPPVWSRAEGALRLRANDSAIRLTGITLTRDGCEQTRDDVLISGKEEVTLVDNAGDFMLNCTMRREAGWKGLYIDFAQGAQGNGFRWGVGGWENQDSIIEKRERGRGSNLGQAEFSVEDNTEYTLRLELKNRRIRTWINGTLMNDAVDRPVSTEPLYLAASAESDDVILKAVNVRDTPCIAEISWGGTVGLCRSETLAGLPDDPNTLGVPDKIVPQQHECYVNETFTHSFPPYSVTVLRIAPGDR